MSAAEHPRLWSRRLCLAAPLCAATLPAAWAQAARALSFPADAGSHNDFAIEWWYITGYAHRAGNGSSGALDSTATPDLGFQVTFFRSRVAAAQGLKSRLAARQLLFAQAAVTDVKGQRLWHDQRSSRWSGEPPGANAADTASASSEDSQVDLRGWHLGRVGPDWQVRIHAADFALNLQFKAVQPVLLQGQHGLSRKGPDPRHSSYYYSIPQLQTSGTIQLQGQTHRLGRGSTAWFDHEWSQAVLHPDAVGWDWMGINLLDGGALTAFQIRTPAGQALWDGGSFRTVTGQLTVFSKGDTRFKPVRWWHSQATGATYPVQWTVQTPAGLHTVTSLVDNQELDSRASTGAVYWEGLCDVHDATRKLVGRGYLEMTGYAAPLKL